MVLFLAGCAREPTSDKKAGASEPPAAASNIVRLSAAQQQQADIRVETVRIQSMPQTLRSPARLVNNENRTWRIGAITEGRVVMALANPGDAVSAGQVLARLHSHEIHESRAQYTRAMAELARARAASGYAARLRDRARRLYELKAGSLEQLEHAEAEVRNAETAVRSAEAEVERTERHLTEFLGIPSELSGERHNQDDDLIPVRAPASGVVLARNVTAGAVVGPAAELFVLADLSSLWALADVNEEHLSKLRVGMPARVFVQAYGARGFGGRIEKLGEALDPNTRTVKVRVAVPNRQRLLKPEMYATAEITLGGSGSGLFIPVEAIQEMRGQTVVFVRLEAVQFEARPVELGLASGGATQVLHGLQTGEAVVTSGSFILKSEFLKASLAGEE
jgi:multidrug efflux pump subunit AcrA (membrane-fusion protein)